MKQELFSYYKLKIRYITFYYKTGFVSNYQYGQLIKRNGLQKAQNLNSLHWVQEIFHSP